MKTYEVDLRDDGVYVAIPDAVEHQPTVTDVMVETLVALCPLLGLLGTVTGMIAVFEVMAVTGGGNARSMASGVSMATIPTMAGMVGALSGVFLVTVLVRTVKRRITFLEDRMTMDH